MVNVVDPVPLAFVAETVTEEVPGVVAAPVIIPVEESIDKPAGNPLAE
jgi:hypothetical protein